LFAYFEQLLQGLLSNQNGVVEEHSRFLRVIQESKDDLIKIGYNEFTFEYFYDVGIIYLHHFSVHIIQIGIH
jgi:hypothetical protein